MCGRISDPYRSPLEAGIRAVVVLEQLRPTSADLSEVVLYDYVVVHASDVGGPMSLHPAVVGRKDELLVRRGIVEAGLDLMCRCHLLERLADDEGFKWRASEEAASYVELLESAYSDDLKTCAGWLAAQVRGLSMAGFKSMVAQNLSEHVERPNSTLGAFKTKLAADHSTLGALSVERQRLASELDELTDQADEAVFTIERFNLLETSFASDIRRLTMLREGAEALMAGAKRPCELCGADPEHQHVEHGLEAVETSRRAVTAELRKVRAESAGLTKAINSLWAELIGIQGRIATLIRAIELRDGETEAAREITFVAVDRVLD